MTGGITTNAPERNSGVQAPSLSGQFDTQLCHYFALCTRFVRSWLALGEEETISRNNETISNPAITAPTNISDPFYGNFP
jgi:hypothetical protein